MISLESQRKYHENNDFICFFPLYLLGYLAENSLIFMVFGGWEFTEWNGVSVISLYQTEQSSLVAYKSGHI